MIKSCCIVSCTYNIKKNQKLKFDNLPKDEVERRKWLNAINRAADSSACSKHWSPKSSNVYVCSTNFITNGVLLHLNFIFLNKYPNISIFLYNNI